MKNASPQQKFHRAHEVPAAIASPARVAGAGASAYSRAPTRTAETSHSVKEEAVFRFLSGSIRSVWALELLLLLRRDRTRGWDADGLVRELRGSQFVVSEAIHNLKSAGLVAQDAEGLTRYQPATPELEAASSAVEALYAAKPMAVIKAIANAPNEKLRIFSDAFKLKD